jgi:hypothetical protein
MWNVKGAMVEGRAGPSVEGGDSKSSIKTRVSCCRSDSGSRKEQSGSYAESGERAGRGNNTSVIGYSSSLLDS